MTTEISLADYDFALPPERIAQHPPDARDGARMLVLDRARGDLQHAHIRELPAFLEPAISSCATRPASCPRGYADTRAAAAQPRPCC